MIGSRYLRGVSVVNWPLRRIILSTFANRYIRAVTGLRPMDCTSGYRCWRREALAKLPLDTVVSDGYAFLVEMLFEAHRRGARIGEVPIIFVERRLGVSKLSSGVLLRVVPDAVAASPAVDRAEPFVSARHRVVMVATSYPRFPGDTVGTFMEPIAHGMAARGHEVHMVLPWHPRWTRPPREGGVTFHLFRYAPARSLNVFGYAGALRADVSVRGAALMATPLALTAGWRAARTVRETDWRDAHARPLGRAWRRDGGRRIARHCRSSISLHGSDVYLAERHGAIGRVARWTFAQCRRRHRL